METLRMNSSAVVDLAKELFREERARTRLDGWFLIRESCAANEAKVAAHAAPGEGGKPDVRRAFPASAVHQRVRAVCGHPAGCLRPLLRADPTPASKWSPSPDAAIQRRCSRGHRPERRIPAGAHPGGQGARQGHALRARAVGNLCQRGESDRRSGPFHGAGDRPRDPGRQALPSKTACLGRSRRFRKRSPPNPIRKRRPASAR